MEEETTVEPTVNETKYEKLEPLDQKQFSQYWDSLPYSVRKAYNKQTKGELAPVSQEELRQKLVSYLDTKNE